MEIPSSIFVGSLPIEATSEMLENYFSAFGDIESAVVIRDPVSHMSRGFGFVNFTKAETKSAVLNFEGSHVIDGKAVECKPAYRKNTQGQVTGTGMPGAGLGMGQVHPGVGPTPPGPGGRFEQSSASPSFDNQCKVFVGGIANGTTDEDIKEALGQYGTVLTVEQKYDKTTNRMRGFGFVEFSDPKTVQKVVSIRFLAINGKTVEIKMAENRQPLQYGQSTAGYNTPGSFGNSMSMYSPYFSPYGGNTGGNLGSGGAPSYMGGSYPSNPGYGGNSQYGAGNTYTSAASVYGSSSGYGMGSGPSYGSSSGYARGGYPHHFGQQ